MIAVSDTTPLNYLLQIDSVHLLPAIYARVCVPSAVQREMRLPKAPQVVRDFASTPPVWTFVEPDRSVADPDVLALDMGEAQAIAAYEFLQADFLLTDDLRARKVAEARGIRVVPTLLILDAAADRGWISFSDVVAKLTKTNFRVDTFLIDQLLDKHKNS